MQAQDGAVSGRLRTWLRLEGAALLAGASVLYGHSGASWWLFVVLFLVPDISFAGYLAGPRVGAWAYNLCHTSALCWALGIAGFLSGSSLAVAVALIWAAHVGFDRMLGYGLKDEAGFHFTHLGPIGPAARRPSEGRRADQA